MCFENFGWRYYRMHRRYALVVGGESDIHSENYVAVKGV